MSKGIFISFEGVDGLGKSTQIRLLSAALQRAGHDVVMTKEPGDGCIGSNVGKGIRELLFSNPTTKNMHPGVADLLFLADHVQTAGDIERFMSDGKIVLCDRYADSQFAYAAHPAKKAPLWTLRYFQEHFRVVPDITVLMVARGPVTGSAVPGTPDALADSREDISWALNRARSRKGAEAGKQEGKAWGDNAIGQFIVQEAYLSQIGKEARTEIIHVWPESSVEEVHDAIMTRVLRRFASLGVGMAPVEFYTGSGTACSDYAASQ